ncbi:sensor histidine kinase [Lentzea tibetensis]|uniref:Sensor histidine kinase n=1 Tax=Lentzea tibetensis TaxID=2591470 RepID=A0A563EF46_9PSEU|nr:sensor histidine kinase [Lentzea tibetensis]TWP44177.1 sensor histidine kinase [Lentzea tibetensis]
MTTGHTRSAAIITSVSLLLLLAELAVFAAHRPDQLLALSSQPTAELWQYVLQGASLVLVGFLVLVRSRRRALGRMLLIDGFAWSLAALLSTCLRFTTEITSAVQAAVWAEYMLWQIPRILTVLVPLCFPDGRLPGRWARSFAAGLSAIILGHEALDLLTFAMWRPGGIEMANALYSAAWQAPAEQLKQVLGLIAWPGIVVAAVSPAFRWLRADSVTRRQITIALPVFVFFLIEEGVRQLLTWSPWVAGLKVAVTVLWPTAIGYVVVRDQLFLLDRAARRIIATVVPAVLLVAVYTAAAAAVAVSLPGASSALAAMLAVLAALVGLVLRPANTWVSRRVDRLLYGERAEPYHVTHMLAGRLRDNLGHEQVPVGVCQIVVSALRIPAAAIDINVSGSPRRLAAVGDIGRLAAAVQFELCHQGTLTGWLLVPPRDGQRELDDMDQAVLQSLADLSAPAVSALILYEQLEASRQRVITARDDERRRLSRDVHDGLGPSLAAIRMRVDTASALLPAGSPSSMLLDDISRDLRDIVAETRRITEDLQPSTLERHGLPEALDELSNRLHSPALEIVTDMPNRLPALPADVELAAYRIAAEALTNAVRHSGATHATVRLAVRPDSLLLEVRDDGTGIRDSTTRRGVGLLSMAERAAEIGGSCEITSGPEGTAVVAVFPTSPQRP